MLALDAVRFCIGALARHERQLLPSAHLVWAPLVSGPRHSERRDANVTPHPARPQFTPLYVLLAQAAVRQRRLCCHGSGASAAGVVQRLWHLFPAARHKVGCRTLRRFRPPVSCHHADGTHANRAGRHARCCWDGWRRRSRWTAAAMRPRASMARRGGCRPRFCSASPKFGSHCSRRRPWSRRWRPHACRTSTWTRPTSSPYVGSAVDLRRRRPRLLASSPTPLSDFTGRSRHGGECARQDGSGQRVACAGAAGAASLGCKRRATAPARRCV